MWSREALEKLRRFAFEDMDGRIEDHGSQFCSGP